MFFFFSFLQLGPAGGVKKKGCSDAGVFFIFISSVIVILFVLRKRYQKDSLAHMKNSGEIHEQLVTYDEEGGGEMDTNGYDAADGPY